MGGRLGSSMCALAWLACAAAPAAASEPQAGGLAYGQAFSGVTDRVYAYGPPNWAFVSDRSSGAFLNCGDGARAAAHDAHGQSTLDVACGVTLSETVSIPQVGPKARLTIHY